MAVNNLQPMCRWPGSQRPIAALESTSYLPPGEAPFSDEIGAGYDCNEVASTNLHFKCAEYRKWEKAQRKFSATVGCCV